MFSRYENDTLSGTGGYSSSFAISNIRKAVKAGAISYTVKVTQEGDRLDHFASNVYGDGRLWWIIAAASNIGWWLQVPPGTVIRIPVDMEEVRNAM